MKKLLLKWLAPDYEELKSLEEYIYNFDRNLNYVINNVDTPLSLKLMQIITAKTLFMNAVKQKLNKL